ncbi:hypothetical protein [Chryseobacterium taklimakanense]|uniref:Uncharacterized protein n=1 Tax=Chryseobacterium taklimakanense TaxID=536441 RepID=A0A3G8WLM5_9FLAO|nr:hypothetical protein [Chryseobacterium taklimakanense]AZI21499.1 hypothetical protein EIH08_12370 [Chryseobacterium taklimakanense]
MEDKKLTVGKNIYSELRKNNRTVWGVVIVAVVAIVSMLYFALYVYSDAGNKLYTINNKGDLIPLSLVSAKKTRLNRCREQPNFS